MDIGFEGRDYTWTSNSYGTGTRKARLDMALINNDWSLNFSNAKLLHLNFIASDHCPTMLISDPIPKSLWRPFKFFRTWLGHNNFNEKLELSWSIDILGSTAHRLKQKQHSARITLSQWNRMEFGDIQKNISNLQNLLETVQNGPTSDMQHARVKEITSDLENWYKIQTEFYKENSRDKTGMDNNSRYFHTMVNKRKHTNNISVLCDANGNWYRDRESISNFLTSHFSSVASSSNPILFDDDFDVIPSIITESDNLMLHVVPTDIEIENIVKNMPAWSSPGPDGFQAGFYQTQWHLVGREIHDNIIIAHEMIHYMKQKEGMSGTMAIKLDLSKAFDRLEWNFLNKVLEKFGSSKDFCNLVMQCVSTTNISVLLNGSPCSQFEPTRVIRQGDPLSPYLFILAMEYLSRSLLYAETNDIGQANMHHIDHVLRILQNFGNLSDSEKYLGAPLLLGHSKLKSFDPIAQSFGARLNNYVSTTVNQAGKSNFNQMNFGGVINQILSAKYFKNCSILHLEKLNESFFWIWRGIYRYIDIIKENSFWAIRCGTKTKIWLDGWVIGLDKPSTPAEGLVNYVAYIHVADLFISGTRVWNFHLINYLFPEDTTHKILAMSIPAIGDDTLIWLPDRKGYFYVKSVYHVLIKPPNSVAGYQAIPSQHGTFGNWVLSWFSTSSNLNFGN
ncbi:uncharacterized protein LOC113351724 [Papaver somniferum]|uniref:uncharacterized protein LOC113351724 n=1 Tax=Papaver somniferum TaxID=3469 RepID=UPI000E6FE2C7|nr:uncharacterized protein LOC113351724 [Papaver somniferum]